MKEEFRKIPGYEDSPYYVSSLHGVTNGKKYLKPYNGSVTIRYRGRSVTEYVDELVARAFVKNFDNKPYLYHLDKDWKNCAANNLVYVDNSDILEPESNGWKYIPGLNNIYMAHPSGIVKSVGHFTPEIRRGTNTYKYYPGTVLNGTTGSDGYIHVMVSTGKTSKYISVHRLVASTFLPNPDNLPQVNHIDGNKQNNELSNLEWCSRIHNMNHAKNLGLWNPKECGEISKRLTGKPVVCLDDNREYASISECARYYNMDPQSVKESISTERPRKGFRFQYLPMVKSICKGEHHGC